MQSDIYAHATWREPPLRESFNCFQDTPSFSINMSKLSSLMVFLLCISARPIDAAVVPASAPGRVYPEVVPGPGLPSLASLNLTSAMLFESKNHRRYIPIPRSRLMGL